MIKPNYFFEFLIANLDIIDLAKQNTAKFCQNLLAQGISGTEAVYNALNKKRTIYASLTYQDLAKFAKEIYAIRYAQVLHDDPKSELVTNKDWTPENISEKECFDMFFSDNQFTQWGFSNQTLPFAPMSEENKNSVLAEQFIHFCPNGYPEKTAHTDSRKITKRIYFNVSPQNALNITRELAKFASETGEKVYCKFSTSAKRSDPLLFYTNEDQLPRLMNFLDQVEAVHPEYLEPADCCQPFIAPVRPYCGIADEPEDVEYYSNGKLLTQKTSFNHEMASAMGEFLDIAKGAIFNDIDIKNAKFVVGKDNKVLNAHEYTEYMTWLKFGQTILKTQKQYQNASDEYGKSKKQLADELWEQYLEARANPKHHLAKAINETSKNLYQGILNKEIATKASVSIRTQVDYEKFLFKNSSKQQAKESFERNGYWETAIDIDFNLYAELFKNFDLNKTTQPLFDTKYTDNFFNNVEKYMDNHKRSNVIPFLNISTVANFNEYWQAKERGVVAYTSSGITPAKFNTAVAPEIKQGVTENSTKTHSADTTTSTNKMEK